MPPAPFHRPAFLEYSDHWNVWSKYETRSKPAQYFQTECELEIWWRREDGLSMGQTLIRWWSNQSLYQNVAGPNRPYGRHQAFCDLKGEKKNAANKHEQGGPQWERHRRYKLGFIHCLGDNHKKVKKKVSKKKHRQERTGIGMIRTSICINWKENRIGGLWLWTWLNFQLCASYTLNQIASQWDNLPNLQHLMHFSHFKAT